MVVAARTPEQMTPTASDEIRAKIESFVAGLEELVRRAALESVQQALGSSGPASASALAELAVGSKRGRARRAEAGALAAPSKRGKRTGAEVEALAEKLHKYIGKHPGQRMEQISAGMNVSSKDLTLPLQKLKGDRKLKTKGQKRATEYYAK
jgi:hypothetical protein